MPTPNDQQSGSQNSSDQNQEPKVDQTEIANLVNSAVTAQLKRALPKALDGIMPVVQEAISKQFEELKAKPQDEPKDKQDPAKPPPEILAMQRQLEEMKTKVQEAENRREAAERKQRDDRAFAELRNHLAKGGVRPELLDDFAKVLFHADKRVEFDADGSPLIRVRVPVGKGLPEEEQVFPLEAGVSQLLKSKGAAPYMPPPGGAGGGGGGSAPQPGGTRRTPQYDKPAVSDDERARRVAERMAAMGLDSPL